MRRTQENFSQVISRASRIPIRSAGIDLPLGLPKGRPDQANGSARQSTKDPGGIIPLWGAASSRNRGGFLRNQQAGVAISEHGKGAWRDNGLRQRLWRTAKYEEIYLRAYDSVSEARAVDRPVSGCQSAHKTDPRSASKIGSESKSDEIENLAWLRSGLGIRAMDGFDVSELVPGGFVVECATRDGDGFVIAIRGVAMACRCPMCGAVSGRVHSYYQRRLADLPAAGARIALNCGPAASSAMPRPAQGGSLLNGSRPSSQEPDAPGGSTMSCIASRLPSRPIGGLSFASAQR